jgi:hypothetical protein
MTQQLGSKVIKKVSYGASANWNETDEREAVIQIPHGWMIVNVKDNRTSNFGRTSMNVDQIQANGHFASNQEVNSAFKEMEEGMVNAGVYGTYGGKATQEKNRWSSARNQMQSSHSAIRIKVSAKGSGNALDRKGGSIQGTYEATLCCVGTTDDLKTSVFDLLATAGFPSGYFVKIRNPRIGQVNFSFKFGNDPFESKTLEKNKIRTFSTKSLTPRFAIRFDGDTRPGFQAVETTLKTNSTYRFELNGTSIRLVKE